MLVRRVWLLACCDCTPWWSGPWTGLDHVWHTCHCPWSHQGTTAPSQLAKAHAHAQLRIRFYRQQFSFFEILIWRLDAAKPRSSQPPPARHLSPVFQSLVLGGAWWCPSQMSAASSPIIRSLVLVPSSILHHAGASIIRSPVTRRRWLGDWRTSATSESPCNVCIS
jgi:hypothetical protein